MSTAEKAVTLVSKIFPKRIPAAEHDTITVAVLLESFVADMPAEIVARWAQYLVWALNTCRAAQSEWKN